jgi:hypothetical protein
MNDSFPYKFTNERTGTFLPLSLSTHETIGPYKNEVSFKPLQKSSLTSLTSLTHTPTHTETHTHTQQKVDYSLVGICIVSGSFG